ncbi:phosphatidylinositol-3-phosphatase SAC1 ASCRUDRAFT_16948, partial [Ascoidea rubescens DSM 1968]
YIKLMKYNLINSKLYYSKNLDLTNSFQRISGLYFNNEKIELNSEKELFSIELLDKRFFWNEFLLKDFLNLKQHDKIQEFILPAISGYCEFIDLIINKIKFSIGLITRRSKFRAGTRYFTRGIDINGNVGNFNETEQVLIIHNESDSYNIMSYLQTRGSIPAYWAEINNLKYAPSLVISERDSIEPSFKHFDEQISKYGKNYLINLINSGGREKKIKDCYEKIIIDLKAKHPSKINDNTLEYIYFDFHHECRKMQWYNVDKLIAKLTGFGVTSEDYFDCKYYVNQLKSEGSSSDRKIEVNNLQKNNIRTNCMDCLDRTNVVQSTFGKWILHEQLIKNKIMGESERLNDYPELILFFQKIWADNADAISFGYSGTGALKTDFTRTGERTKRGVLNDGLNSVTRYILNNYFDGYRQDGYDLILGNFGDNLKAVKNLKFNKELRPLAIQYIPYVISNELASKAATTSSGHHIIETIKVLVVYAVSIGVVGKILLFLLGERNRLQFVSWPSIKPVEFLDTEYVVEEGERGAKGIRYVLSSEFSVEEDKKR